MGSVSESVSFHNIAELLRWKLYRVNIDLSAVMMVVEVVLWCLIVRQVVNSKEMGYSIQCE